MPDSTTLFTSIFIVALVFCVGMQLWLALRQVRHVELHRCEVPPHFADRITLPAHRKAADYTIARTRLSMIADREIYRSRPPRAPKPGITTTRE